MRAKTVVFCINLAKPQKDNCLTRQTFLPGQGITSLRYFEMRRRLTVPSNPVKQNVKVAIATLGSSTYAGVGTLSMIEMRK